MKRSEMVEIIDTYVKHIADDRYEGLTDMLSKDLLQIIERAGMLPPEYEIVRKGDGIIRKLAYIDYRNGWEPEND
jgi:hypothetical protein